MPVGAGIPLAAGLGLQMAGQYQAGKEAEAQGKYQAAISEDNAKLSEREAIEAQAAASSEERRLRKGGERLKATQRARYAKGLTFEGSPTDFMEQTASELELDALNIRRGGQLGYQRYTSEAALHRVAGKSALLRGRSAKRKSYWNMASAGVMGGGQLGYMALMAQS